MQVLPCQGRVLELTTQVIGLTNLAKHKWALLNHYVAAHGRLPGAQATGATGGSAAGPAAQGVKRVRFKSKGGRSTEDVVGWVGGKTLAPRLSRDSAAEPPAQSGALLRLGRVRGPSS